ncbi:MAG TPA: D-alanyl-D-alanine carboxypeptidase family protein [Thermoanaerobaculia bacterium]|nr:D-alanyl-D-alanine carboxypeptidase family protein [Thermoanaerobaculia bacterium]
MKRVVIVLLSLALSSSLVAQSAEKFTAGIVIEPTTGQVLYEKNAHTPMPPASMIKMMTLLIVMENIQNGMLAFDSPVTVSARASKMGGSQVYLKQGEVFTVRDLLAATMVHSANDAALALAERVGGTAEAFVNLMNRRAESLGLRNSEFHTPHGLPARGDEKPDMMSPADLAKLAQELMKYPLMREYALVQQMPFRGGTFTMYNPNHLLRQYPDSTGIKTGYTVSAGFCVTASAKRGNMELISVVMGSKQKRDCFDSAASLLTEAFNTWRLQQVIAKGARLPVEFPVKQGAAPRVAAVAGDSAMILVKHGEEKGLTTAFGPVGAVAPIRKGQQVGTIIVRKDGKPVASVPAIAAADLGKESWWRKFWPF